MHQLRTQRPQFARKFPCEIFNPAFVRNSFSFTLINTPEIRNALEIFVTHHHKAELKFRRKKFRHFRLNYIENPHEDGPRCGKRERLCLFVRCRFFRANCVFRFFFRPLRILRRIPEHHTASICPKTNINTLIECMFSRGNKWWIGV